RFSKLTRQSRALAPLALHVDLRGHEVPDGELSAVHGQGSAGSQAASARLESENAARSRQLPMPRELRGSLRARDARLLQNRHVTTSSGRCGHHTSLACPAKLAPCAE